MIGGHNERMRLLWAADRLDAGPLPVAANEELAALLRDVARHGVEPPLPLDALPRMPTLHDDVA